MIFITYLLRRNRTSHCTSRCPKACRHADACSFNSCRLSFLSPLLNFGHQCGHFLPRKWPFSPPNVIILAPQNGQFRGRSAWAATGARCARKQGSKDTGGQHRESWEKCMRHAFCERQSLAFCRAFHMKVREICSKTRLWNSKRGGGNFEVSPEKRRKTWRECRFFVPL